MACHAVTTTCDYVTVRSYALSKRSKDAAPRDRVTVVFRNERISDIEKRNDERREFRRHLPSGPYFYDSLGYVP